MPSELTYSRVMIAAAIRIAYLAKESNSGNDLTVKVWPATLCALIVESFSIVTACIPYLKPFLNSLESGMMNNDQLRREGLSHLYSRNKFRTTDNSSQEPKKASYDVSSSSKPSKYLHLGSSSHTSTEEDYGVFCGPREVSLSVKTTREIMMAA